MKPTTNLEPGSGGGRPDGSARPRRGNGGEATQLTPGLRRFLNLTACVAGAAILVVEILGAKMLAPYVGTSHFVWTAQIAVTLISLAGGYALGGWASDRTPRLAVYFRFLAIAGVALALSIPLVEPIAFACVRLPLPVAALVCSAALYVVPLTLMATTVPFLIRVLASSMDQVGMQAGRLSAVSTLGSVAGVVLIGYVLIPFLPNSVTMGITAGILVLIPAIHALKWGRKEGASFAGAGLALLLCAGLAGYGIHAESTHQFSEVKELARMNSNFGKLQVVESKEGRRRYYLNDYLMQNTYDVVQKKSTSLFTYMLHGLTRGYAPGLNKALCIGLGVGIVPMQLVADGIQVDVAEINPAIIGLAEQYFDFEPSRMNIHIADGRQFINQTTNRYDAIVLDAFLGDSSPGHLMTREAFGSMKSHMAPEGVLVMNCFGDFAAGADFFVGSIDRTLRSVFKEVRMHASGNGNVFFAASDRSPFNLMTDYDFSQVHGSVRSQVQSAFNGVRNNGLDRGRILTDDFNPVEFYDAQNREKMRRNLALFIKEL